MHPASFLLVGHGHNGIDIGLTAVGDPLLGPVQHIIIAIQHGSGFATGALPAIASVKPKAQMVFPQQSPAGTSLCFQYQTTESGNNKACGGVTYGHTAAGAEILHQAGSKTPPPNPPYSSGRHAAQTIRPPRIRGKCPSHPVRQRLAPPFPGIRSQIPNHLLSSVK